MKIHALSVANRIYDNLSQVQGITQTNRIVISKVTIMVYIGITTPINICIAINL